MKDAAVNKKPAPAGLLNIVKTYSFVLVFLVIYIVYASVSGGFALGAAMNVFRHSAVIGVIAIGMGIVCLTGDIDLSVGSMLAFVAGFSVVVFLSADAAVCCPFWSAVRLDQRCARRHRADAVVYRHVGNDAYLSLPLAVCVPAYPG